jgi:hypothetical protein
MAQAKIIEGTTEEIARLLEQGYSGQKLRVFVESEVEDMAAVIPAPPFAISDPEHLKQLLLESLNSPTHAVTPEVWSQIRQEAIDQSSRRNPR